MLEDQGPMGQRRAVACFSNVEEAKQYFETVEWR
jgi:hypothetical protein